MTTTKLHLGKEIYCNEHAFERALFNWNKKLIPAINKIGMLYEELKLGEFTQGVLNSMIATGINEVKAKYTEAAKKEVKAINLNLLGINLNESIDQNLKPLAAEIGALPGIKKECAGARHSEPPLIIEWSDCTILNGRAQLNEVQLRNRYCLFIDSETKSELWDKLTKLKKQHNDLAEFLNNNGYDTKRFGNCIYDNDGNGLVQELEDGSLHINPFSIKMITVSQNAGAA